LRIKRFLKRCFRALGWRLTRYRASTCAELQLSTLLKWKDVDLVLDVGANIGQFGQCLREHGYHGRIVSFEPLSRAYEVLLDRRRDDPLWTVAPRMALGATRGEVRLHISGNSESSSILDMLPAHLVGAPDSRYTGSEVVSLETLDSVWDKVVPAEHRAVFLKIDVQGYESEVLRGADHALRNVVGVQVELSLVPLYDGQALYQDLMDRLGALGFELCGVATGFVDPATGRTLQLDGIFLR
jgi:FkbM family methyltransferase